MKCYIINIDLKVDQFYELTGENIWRIPKKQSCLLSKYGGGYASSERPLVPIFIVLKRFLMLKSPLLHLKMVP